MSDGSVMKAIGYREQGPLDRPDALLDIELPKPRASGRDLLVAVEAVSVNPVDTKIRRAAGPLDGHSWRVLGWDAAGIVAETGPDAAGFAVGDAVFYAGALSRQGANSAFHLVDARIVGRKPASLSMAEAAALPLTALTAWETLFDRLEIDRPNASGSRVLLVVGGAGGVGSIAIQLARTLTDCIVVATASRPETAAWCREMGAHHVIDHSKPLAAEFASLGIDPPGNVFSTTETHRHVDEIAALIAPQGRFALIDDPESLSILAFKRKSVSIHWELMFTRSLFETADIARQGWILNEVSGLVEAGRIRTTLTEHLSPIDAANLRRAHATLESGRARGKIVLEGFGGRAVP